MIEIIMAISAWCAEPGNTSALTIQVCKEARLECVVKDLMPGDYSNKEYLQKKLLQCLRKSKGA